MTTPGVAASAPAPTQRLGAWRQPLSWLALLALSAVISAGWGALGLPAALLLGSPVHWGNLAIVLALALLGQQLGRLLRLQAWALLGPIILSALHAAGWLNIDLYQSRRPRLGGDYRRLDPARRFTLRAGPAGGAVGVRHRPGAAHYPSGGQTLAAPKDSADLNCAGCA
jgi:hypothetical protein